MNIVAGGMERGWVIKEHAARLPRHAFLWQISRLSLNLHVAHVDEPAQALAESVIVMVNIKKRQVWHEISKA
jgi:hypothetical protein